MPGLLGTAELFLYSENRLRTRLINHGADEFSKIHPFTWY